LPAGFSGLTIVRAYHGICLSWKNQECNTDNHKHRNGTVESSTRLTIDGVTDYLLTNQWQYLAVVSGGVNWLILEQK